MHNRSVRETKGKDTRDCSKDQGSKDQDSRPKGLVSWGGFSALLHLCGSGLRSAFLLVKALSPHQSQEYFLPSNQLNQLIFSTFGHVL
jgi:hypothetical protein